MGGVGLIAAIIIGLLAGLAADRLMKHHHGLLTALAVGLVGALIGEFLANVLGLVSAGLAVGPALSALGAAALLLLLGLIRKS